MAKSNTARMCSELAKPMLSPQLPFALVRGYFSKYNEDEERDEHGRWTSGGDSGSGASPPLTGEQQAIQDRFAAQLKGMTTAELSSKYGALRDSQGGKVLNVDVARELSKDYLSDRTQAAAVHEPASTAVKELYAQKLSEEPKGNEKPLVLFTAGGTGAGKSTAIGNLPEISGIKNSAQIIYDTNMQNYGSALSKIDQALGAGKSVIVGYVYREPVEALVKGALTRAMAQEGQYGSGRTVPIDEHARTHIGAHDTVGRLQEHFADNPRVRFMVVDNSHGHGGQRASTFTALPKPPSQHELTGRLHGALNREYTEGRISKAVYKGFAGHA